VFPSERVVVFEYIILWNTKLDGLQLAPLSDAVLAFPLFCDMNKECRT
jgi:hypothetical protein